MNKVEIKTFIESFSLKRERTIVVVDFANVVKWDVSLRWRVGIKELGHLARQFSIGQKFLRRFYYGADYGSDESIEKETGWSQSVREKANISGFELMLKRVKYIHIQDGVYDFEKKCDLDVEMAIDLVKERENYDTIILFSGDGDLMYAIRYLKEAYGKDCYVFGVRDNIGREIVDAQRDGIVKRILYVEDFEYRLSMEKNH
jgi:uncharacterized LabA/DUF88 family protein